jgi:DNA oxidative demethylase
MKIGESQHEGRLFKGIRAAHGRFAGSGPIGDLSAKVRTLRRQASCCSNTLAIGSATKLIKARPNVLGTSFCETWRDSVAPDGFRRIRKALSPAEQRRLVKAIADIADAAPFYQPSMPKTGRPFSVRMTNAGPLGWVSDKSGGYRYQPLHPLTGAPWPAIPKILLQVWRDFADYTSPPEACLINHYEARARMGSHQDRDEQDLAAPVVSISLGDDAMFHVGGLKRDDPKERIRLQSGDVVVLGKAARLAYHGIDRVFAGSSSLLPGGGRINLTLRRVRPPNKE